MATEAKQQCQKPSGSSSPWSVGVHLSGSNSQRTAVVALCGNLLEAPPRIVKVYEKIGSFGSLFSDERLVGILEHMPCAPVVFVDCPLSLPPCVSCNRPTCPGVVKCEDVSVAYMMSLSAKVKQRRAQKHRPLNPQSQRLWDAWDLARKGTRREPTFSANLAPLVARARVLQRRLNALSRPLQLAETSVPLVLETIAPLIGADTAVRSDYRSFEIGSDTREQIIDEMVRMGWIASDTLPVVKASLYMTVECFHAFIAAWMGVLHQAMLTEGRPNDFVQDEGWVFAPRLTQEIDF